MNSSYIPGECPPAASAVATPPIPTLPSSGNAHLAVGGLPVGEDSPVPVSDSVSLSGAIKITTDASGAAFQAALEVSASWGDPQWLDRATGDFRIPLTSPARARVAAMPSAPVDYSGAAFSSPASAGAYEAA